MADTFRLAPPEVRATWIDRPRLTALLARRFEVDVVLMTAPAGYGKTSALSLALADNKDERLGLDLWFQCEPSDDDPDVLGAGILAAAGLSTPASGFSASPAKLADALLRFAPQPVCLVVDDVHVLTAGSGGVALLDELVGCLPTNAHLLLSGRAVPPIRLARRRAQGRSLDLDADDLAFDDDEVDLALPGHEQVDPAVARWPAMVALLVTGSASATVDFLLEEVAGALGSDRLAPLTALSHVRTVTEAIARAASDGQYGADELLGHLPLVQRTSDGAFQMHDLWRDALVRDRLADDAAEAMRRVAHLLLAADRCIDAAELFDVAGDVEGVELAAETFAAQDLLFVRATDLRQMAARAHVALPGRPVTALLDAGAAGAADAPSAIAAMEASAALAQERGEQRVEAIALHQAVFMRTIFGPFEFPPAFLDRAEALAQAGEPAAPAVAALIDSLRARSDGDPDAASDHLSVLVSHPSPSARVEHAFAVLDLGRPEEITLPAPGEPVMASMALAVDRYRAQAAFMRGQIEPEMALHFGQIRQDEIDSQEVAHARSASYATLSLLATVTDERSVARDYADRAARLGGSADEPLSTFAAVADAAALTVEQGDDAARERLDRMLEAVPIEPWPYRSYLYAVPLLYVLVPGTRAVLDRCRFGPALASALQAAQALVALRERDDADPALEVAWDQPWLLRIHVVPPHLAQLAAAAAAGGHTGVGEVLAQLPAPQDHLSRATTLGHGPTATWASRRLAQIPVPPDFDLQVSVLGPVTAARGVTEIIDEAWTRRERVRQLLAYLVLQRRVSRRRVAEDLWPELPVERGLQNLRVNLSHLQRVLQPTRDSDERPWFIRSDQEQLEIASEGIIVDADLLQARCAEARSLDERALGTRAIDRYREAAEGYRGDYLVEWPDADWAAIERVRLRTLATAAMTRLGELLLARGEPEQATAWATTALRHEPLLERSHRLFVRGLAGQGNRPTAAEAAEALVSRLATEGLDPEPETRRMLLGLLGPGG